MIWKSGRRLSEKIMLHENANAAPVYLRQSKIGWCCSLRGI
jgi:hypothetical protein